MRRSAAPSSISLLAGVGLFLLQAVTASAVPPTIQVEAHPTAPPPASGPSPLRPADCRNTLETLKLDFAREPGRILLAVEDALTTQETCACPVIRTAVSLAGTDSALISRIVITAIRAVPAAAARITECAITQSPDSAEAIRAALAKELGTPAEAWLDPRSAPEKSSEPESASVAAVEQGKNAVSPPIPDDATAGEEADFDEETWPTVGISGIYSVFSPANRVRNASEDPVPHLEQLFSGKKKTVQPPIFPVTRNIPE